MKREKGNMIWLMVVILLLVAISFMFLKKYGITDFGSIGVSSTDKIVESQQYEEEPVQDQIIISIDDDPILGDPYAPVTIIEFSDYECPYCKKHFNGTHQKLKENYIDKGLVKLVYRDFPLSFHDPLATQEAMAAECAREQGGDEVYFQYHDLIFQTTKSNGKGMKQSKLYELADEIGVNADEFKECLDTEKYKNEVQKDLADGKRYGITGTPAFFINGIGAQGAMPYSEFEKVIEEELAKLN